MFFKYLALICAILAVTISFVNGQGPECRPGYCDNVPCGSKENCNKPNQSLQSTPCGCCPVCFTLLGEGESCPRVLLGGPPATAACKDGLQCVGGICREINN